MPAEGSDIARFFQNQTIFLTGGTGFLGKLLIEKLLRSCWDVRRIYVLMRPKRNKTPQQRFEEIFDFPCFDLIRHKNVKEKVFLVAGDCDEPHLGLSPTDVEILTKEATCVLHVAANLKFDQSLKEASRSIAATKEMVDLAKTMPNLQAFVFISTAYSNCIYPQIKEEFYKPPLKAEGLLALLKVMSDEALIEATPTLLGNWPNTYVFTKCISEDFVRRAGAEIPVAVVRPSIITNTMEEPTKGWIDNIYGFTGVNLGLNLGVVRSIHGINEKKIHLVPADHVCNCILAATWKRAKVKNKVAQVYNCVGEPITLKYAVELLNEFYWLYPSDKYLLYKAIHVRPNKYLHLAYTFSYNVMASATHLFFLCIGKQTNIIKKSTTLNRMIDLLTFFTTNEWQFDENNLKNLKNEMNEQDRKIFKFGEYINLYNYIRICCLGNRLYLLKDPLETIPQGLRKARILFVLHYALLALLYYTTHLLFRSVANFYKK